MVFLNAYGETELIKETVYMLSEWFKETKLPRQDKDPKKCSSDFNLNKIEFIIGFLVVFFTTHTRV